MTKLVMISGQFRSGTSAVAQVVHRLGFPAGLWFAPPYPPKWRSDWEDSEAVTALMRLCPWGARPTDEARDLFLDWFPGYLNRRMACLEMMQDRGVWAAENGVACKSPFYAFFHREIGEVCAKAGMKVRWIVARRDQDEIDASLAEFHGRVWPESIDQIRMTQRLVAHALLSIDGLSVEYGWLVRDPTLETCRIAGFLGVGGSELRASAAAVIGKEAGAWQPLQR